MKKALMIAVLLMWAAPAFAEDLPCESDFVQMVSAERRMEETGHSPAENEELRARVIESEARFDACKDEHEAKNGEESGMLLYGALIRKH